jgi:NADPH:quinone reductase-like Zn-dependent oxidoreductase
MTVARSVADVLADHVVFEVESIDRTYLNVWVCAGHVVATGDGVAAEHVSQRVVVDPALYDGPGENANPIGLLGSEADGGFAQYVVVADQRAHDVTDSPLSDEQLACLPVAYGTAAGMLERAHVRGGETVVVTGASGGVGFALVQLVAAPWRPGHRSD